MECLQKLCMSMVAKEYKGDKDVQKTIVEHSKDFHIFYTGDEEPVEVRPVYGELGIHLDAPFEYCWFEFGRKTPLVLTADKISLRVLGVLVEELEPTINRLAFLIHTFNEETKQAGIALKPLIFKNGLIQGGIPSQVFTAIYQHILRLLLSSKIDNTTYVNSEEYLKYSGRYQGKYISKRHRINQVVYLKSKRYVEKNFPSIAKNISYTHSWEVMGHWRTLPAGQIGKDRNGIPSIKGYCWVVPHVKGKGDLIRKPRKIVGNL